MTTETETVDVAVMRYATGEPVGTIRMARATWQRYADRSDDRFQWPSGIAEAGDVLTRATLDRLGLDRSTAIYLD